MRYSRVQGKHDEDMPRTYSGHMMVLLAEVRVMKRSASLPWSPDGAGSKKVGVPTVLEVLD